MIRDALSGMPAVFLILLFSAFSCFSDYVDAKRDLLTFGISTFCERDMRSILELSPQQSPENGIAVLPGEVRSRMSVNTTF